MPNAPLEHRNARRYATVGFVTAAIIAFVACVYGVYEWSSGGNRAVGVAFLIAGLIGLLFAQFLFVQVLLIYRFANYAYRAYDALLEALELLRRQETHTRMVAENSALSDWAKRVAYREKDYEFLRDSIQAVIVRQDWESAEHLIRDMEREFGFHDEAAHLREKLEKARKGTTEERIAAALARFNSLCEQQKWVQAAGECGRLHELFPNARAIAELPYILEQRKAEVKKRLLREYEQAVKADNIEKAHSLLISLDQYLVGQEVEALKESARSVFRARLEQIKNEFAIAVSFGQFQNAIDAGERLIREFPNSGYAHEISKMLPMLRQRAQGLGVPAGAAAGPTASA